MPKIKDLRKHYDQVYKEHVDLGWDRAPGKEVILKALRRSVESGRISPGSKMVDIGCGSGFFLNRISSEISCPLQLYGVDFSEKAITEGRSQYKLLSLHCEDGSATSFQDGAFSVLISYGSLEHFPEPQLGVQEAGRILEPGGVFFMMLPSLGIYRTDQQEEGWYEDLTGQPQWNYRRETWEKFFKNAGLNLYPQKSSAEFGALKPGVFFFGEKKS